MRLGYMGYLGAAALCSGLAFVGVCRGEANCLVAALAAGGLALGLRYILRHPPAGHEIEGEAVDEFSSISAEDETSREEGVHSRAGELAALLQEWDGLERARGTGRFDPWAVQAVRSEIRVTVQENPALRRLLGPNC